MPANATAAGITEAYRRRVVMLRDAATSTVARQLETIDLDQDPARLRAAYEQWSDDTARLVRAVQVDAAQTTTAYLRGYLAASEVSATWDGPDTLDDHVGRDLRGRPLHDAMRSPWIAVLWQLANGARRESAVSTGVAYAARTSRGAVMGTSRSVLDAGMAAEPSVSGWRRVTATEACLACLALSDTVAPAGRSMQIHDACRCTAEPVLRGVRERVRRPTGSERIEQMSDGELAELLAGRGGAAKAAAIRERGLAAAVTVQPDGLITETPLAALAG